MPNPVTIHHDQYTREIALATRDRPDSCRHAMVGLPWDVVYHLDYLMTVQQTDFFGNHLQLIELDTNNEVSIRFSVDTTSIFFVIMIEGFVRYKWKDKLVSYAMGEVIYMTYNPRSEFLLQTREGNHAMMVISMEPEWFAHTERAYTKLRGLVKSQMENSDKPLILPLCRTTVPITDLWKSMRVVRSEPFRHKVDLMDSLVELTAFYNEQLTGGLQIKGQLSVEIANSLYDFVHRHFASDSELTLHNIAEHLEISLWKVREYAHMLFGKSIHRQVRTLRMVEALQLLQTTSLTINDIAVQVGYDNLPHFYSIFQKYYSTSPASCRKNY
ncbi:helix-turn-helix transcriptional regulator [Sphingobacterium lactis]|uniref:helix-turn-helix transcriptional regulator n=1 Tax=Sphingobacterium lactis TaxID=797291 RepID=UPI003EC7E337